MPLLTKPSPSATQAGTILLQEPSYTCAARSVPTAVKAGPDDATETNESTMVLISQHRGREQGCICKLEYKGLNMGISLTWYWSTSPGEQNGTKAGTDPYGFPVSCYTLTFQECEIEVDSKCISRDCSEVRGMRDSICRDSQQEQIPNSNTFSLFYALTLYSFNCH